MILYTSDLHFGHTNVIKFDHRPFLDRDEAYDFMKTKAHALNAGCMINNYTPASFKELMRNNQAFKKQDTLSYAVITRLLQKNIVVVAACSKRIVRESVVDGKQQKEVEFVFEQFREFRG